MPRQLRRRNGLRRMPRMEIERDNDTSNQSNPIGNATVGDTVHIRENDEMATRINALESLVKSLTERQQQGNSGHNTRFKIDCIP